MYKLLYPEFLGLVILPLVARLLPVVYWNRQALIFPVAEGMPRWGKPDSQGKLKRVLPQLCVWIGWWAWCVALAAPSYVPPPEKKIKEQRSILLATDISLSMETRDWRDAVTGQPVSRWEAVKMLNRQLIHKRTGDRFAHIVFGQEAYLQVPFTDEPHLIVEMQEKLRLGDAGPKTSIGNAIAVAVSHFRSDSVTRKMMILVTDGLDTQEGVSPVQMAQEAARDSVTIYTVAMGSPKEGFKNVDHFQLEEIARVTGGQSFLASSPDDLQRIMEMIDSIEPMEYVIENNLPVRSLYFYPLAVALVMFALGMSLNLVNDRI